MARGFKFFRGTEHTAVKRIRAVRAKYESPDVTRVEVQFQAEDASLPILTLELTLDQAGELAQQLTNAYEAGRPPLARGFGSSTWQGME